MNSKLVILSLLLAGTATAVSAQAKYTDGARRWKQIIRLRV